jgi:hypothetical protein
VQILQIPTEVLSAWCWVLNYVNSTLKAKTKVLNARRVGTFENYYHEGNEKNCRRFLIIGCMVHRTKPLPAGSGLVNDDPQKADACEALFRKAIAGKESLFTSDMVITEIIWVLMAMIPTAKKSHGFFFADRKSAKASNSSFMCGHKSGNAPTMGSTLAGTMLKINDSI